MRTIEGTIGKLSQKCDEVIIDWTIQDIFSYWGPCTVKSPTFYFLDSRWFLRSFLNQQKNGEEFVSLFLYLDKYRFVSDKCVNFEFGVKKADGTFEKLGYDLYWVFTREERSYGRYSFLKKSDLLDRKAELAPSDTLTVTCILRMNPNVSRLNKFSDNLKRRLVSEENCDVTLKVNDKKFLAHKEVLAAESPVFASIFSTGNLHGSSTGTINVVDCQTKAFGDFLEFLYYGKFDRNSSDLFQLYHIADKYHVQELKSACFLSIVNGLTLENVCRTALQGYNMNESVLKTGIQQLFNQNFKEIIKTDDWMTLMKENPTLANELLNEMAPNMEFKQPLV